MNWVEIDRVLEELALEGTFLQNLRQADYHHFYFEFYSPGRPRQVLVCLAPQKLRLHPVVQRPPTLVRPPRFVEFVRHRLVGARVLEARQLGADRTVLWRLGRDGEEYRVWIRLWGGAANIVVTDAQGLVADAAFRRPGSGEVAGQPFDPEAAGAGSTPPTKVFTLRPLAPPEGEAEASYGRRLELLYAQGVPDEVDRWRDQALRLVDRRLNAVAVAREKARARARDAQRQEDWKTYADVLTSEAWRVERGSRSFEGVDWRDGSTFRLDLDPASTVHENAQALYKRYQKARDGAEAAQRDLEALDAEEARWHREAEALVTAEAGEVRAFLERHRNLRPSTNSPSDDPRPGLTFQSGPFTLWVGRNSKENDALLRRYVRGNDLWLHTRDVPGGFVFVRAIRGKTVPLETLLDAGTLAVTFSKAKAEGRADLYCTAVKHLRRPARGPAGLVLPTHEKNLTITVDPGRLQRLYRQREESE